MSCFGCFGGAKDDRAVVTRPAPPQPSSPGTQHQQPSTAHPSSEAKAPPLALPTPAVAPPASVDVVQVQPLACPPPGPPWRSREELADIALRVAGASGPWLERAHTSAIVLAESLGATLITIWAFASDKSTAVVLASGGILRKLQPQGHSVTLGSTEGQSEMSLQRIISRDAPVTWSSESSTSSDRGPQDWQQLATTTGMQHCAMLPLKYGGVLAGALQICLGGSQQVIAAGGDQETGAIAAWPGSASAAQPAPGSAVTTVIPNWLPHHLPELMLLSPATAVGGAACGISSHVASGPGGIQVKPVPQAVVDLVAALRRCDTISKLIGAVIAGLQDLTYRVTSMTFLAMPLLVHRSAVTAAIFQDSSIKEGNTRGDMERDVRTWPAPTSQPPENEEPSKTLKAHITHLNHTLMLQLITGADNNRYRRQYGGSIIQNCSDYMQDESNRGRDVSLCHRVGVADAGSLVLATGVLPGGVPLLCTYLTCREPLPEPMLESALAVVHQALKLSLLAVHALLQQGEMTDEWSTLHDVHLNPSSVAVSTSCTPRSVIRTAMKDAVQHATSMSAGMPNSAPQDEGLMAHSTVSRNLSFGITTSSAAPPRSNLGMMVSSIRSSLNQVLSQRAALEAEGLQDDVNGVELIKQIGQGGQGVVFCGTLHGLEVAIKVVGTEEGADEVYDIDDEGAMIKLKRVLKRDATELAVTTSISHPNIVQVFSYFVDVMVVEYVGQPDRFKLLPKAKGQSTSGAENGGVTGPSNMIICMEYCDAGSLKPAVKKGCFKVEAARPNMQALYTTLMEIALALRHLHALRLVHCDLKPSNILLKSSMRDPRGWVCKLSDFGCVRLMSEPAPGQRPGFNLEYAVGTPSFMAPEMFCKGHPLDAAVDIYSFGILMWEVYTGGTVYDGVPADKLPYHVVKRGLRPAFPPDSPSAFRSLAQACWASDPRSRPTAAALVTVLQRLLSSCVVANPPGGGPGNPGPPGHGA